jgi:hypothetical protein
MVLATLADKMQNSCIQCQELKKKNADARALLWCAESPQQHMQLTKEA